MMDQNILIEAVYPMRTTKHLGLHSTLTKPEQSLGVQSPSTAKKRNSSVITHKKKASIHDYLNILVSSPGPSTYPSLCPSTNNITRSDLKPKTRGSRLKSKKPGHRVVNKRSLQFEVFYDESKCPEMIRTIFQHINSLQVFGYSKVKIARIVEDYTDTFEILHLFLKNFQNSKGAWVRTRVVREERHVHDRCKLYFSRETNGFQEFLLDLRLFQEKLSQYMITAKNQQNARLAGQILKQQSSISDQNDRNNNNSDNKVLTRGRHETSMIILEVSQYLKKTQSNAENQSKDAARLMKTFLSSEKEARHQSKYTKIR